MKKIKFSIRLFIIVMLSLLFIQVPTFAATGKSTVTNLRIRKTPSTTGEVINVLAEGESVEVLGEEADWYKVTFKGDTGYVSKEFLVLENNTDNNVVDNPDNSQNNENNQGDNTTNNQDNQQPVDNNTNSDTKPNIENKVYKITEKTQVYILPVLTSEIIGEVKKGESATVLTNAGLWVYAQTSTISGWIRVDKLSVENVNVDNSSTNNENAVNNENPTNNENQNDNQENNNQQNTYVSKTMYVKGSVVNVRSQSNTSSDVVATAAQNAQVTVIGEENGWYKVEVSGKTGYIRNDLLSETKVETVSRDNQIDRTSQTNKTENTQQTTEKKDETVNEKPNTTTNTQNNTTQQQPTTNEGTQNETTTVEPEKNDTPAEETNTVTGADIVAYAKQFKGYKYVYGAEGPNAFDCSGFTMYVYKHFGYSISRTSRAQATNGKAVTGELQPGDILVFTNEAGTQVGHVGIYIGNNEFIHASTSKTGVIISNLSSNYNRTHYVGARRIL